MLNKSFLWFSRRSFVVFCQPNQQKVTATKYKPDRVVDILPRPENVQEKNQSISDLNFVGVKIFLVEIRESIRLAKNCDSEVKLCF